jgi:hypothetical protein
VHRAADLFQAEGLLKHCQVNIALLAMNISTGIFSRLNLPKPCRSIDGENDCC